MTGLSLEVMTAMATVPVFRKTIARFPSSPKGARMRTTVIGLFVCLTVVASTAQAADKPSPNDAALSGRNRYERCLELSRRNAQKALAEAHAWEANSGGAAATHCAALALVALERYPEAAKQLDLLGHANLASVEERAAIFDQAGNAWLLARHGGEATVSFSSALALSPRDPDLLTDRARAAAMLGDWKAADADLSGALKIDANRADLLVLRASARHALGRKSDARADLEAALRIVPSYPDALLERGTLKLESGDANGARADWQAVVANASVGEAAARAQQRLNALQATKPK
jgi:tetratricopeptide (TPR) repeat protein